MSARKWNHNGEALFSNMDRGLHPLHAKGFHIARMDESILILYPIEIDLCAGHLPYAAKFVIIPIQNQSRRV